MPIHPEAPLIPDNWIGVQAAWQLVSDSPWSHLVSVSPQDLATHALVIGATGTGKTNLLHHLISHDLDRGHSVCVLDLRGDLVSAVTELAADRVPPQKVRIIDLRERNRPFGFNPLWGSGEPYFRALGVLDAIASEADSWGVQLAETLRNALMLLAEMGRPLTDLESLLYDAETRRELVQRSGDPSVAGFWTRFEQMSPDRQAALAMPVLNKVSLLLAAPTTRRILGHPTPFDLGEQLNTPGSVTLVSLAVDEMHATGRMMGAILLSSICREIFARVATPESQRNPVRLYVDEFEHFGGPEFETILAEGRRFRLSLVLAHQTLAQLSPKMRSMVLNNVGVKVAFRCGRDDASTLAKDIFGEPGAYDLCELPTGYCVLWRKEVGVDEVEVNEPLIADVGVLSHEAQLFLDEVYSFAGVISAEPSVPQNEPTQENSEVRAPKRKKRKSLPRSASLEEWL